MVSGSVASRFVTAAIYRSRPCWLVCLLSYGRGEGRGSPWQYVCFVGTKATLKEAIRGFSKGILPFFGGRGRLDF